MKVLFLFFTLISFIATQLNAVECELRCDTYEVASSSKESKRVGHECCDDFPSEEKNKKNPCNDHPNQFINSCYHNYVSDYKKSGDLGADSSSNFLLTPLYLNLSSTWHPHFFSEIKPKIPIDNISYLRKKSQLRLYIQNKQLLN